MTAAPGRDLTERLDPFHVKPPCELRSAFHVKRKQRGRAVSAVALGSWPTQLANADGQGVSGTGTASGPFRGCGEAGSCVLA